MTIHPLYATQPAPGLPQDSAGTAYDTIWAQTGVPAQEPTPLERVMLAEDKLYVVLAVVLILWIGVAFFLLRTDRKLDRLERALDARLPETSQDVL
jgi:hypothetical protein